MGIDDCRAEVVGCSVFVEDHPDHGNETKAWAGKTYRKSQIAERDTKSHIVDIGEIVGKLCSCGVVSSGKREAGGGETNGQ